MGTIFEKNSFEVEVVGDMVFFCGRTHEVRVTAETAVGAARAVLAHFMEDDPEKFLKQNDPEESEG